MKVFKFIVPFFVLAAICIAVPAQAQDIFSQAADITGDVALDDIYEIPASSSSSVVALPAATAKLFGLPASVKKINGPIIIKRGNVCAKIGCKTDNCKDCVLLWKDINTDGKIQPRKELRCACPQSKAQCKLAANKVPCPN